MANPVDNKSIHSGHRQRVKSKALKKGYSQFEDHQLLELLLFYSIPREDTNETAHALLNEFGSIDEVLHASPERLKKVKGVGENTATLITLLGELNCRAAKVKHKRKSAYKSSADFKSLAVSRLSGERNEKVYIFCFDSVGKLKREVELSTGDEASSYIDVKSAVRAMMDSDSKTAVLAHNHPDGTVEPSAADIDSTRSVCVMFRKLGFLLIDHIIVGAENNSYSMYDDSDLSPMFY